MIKRRIDTLLVDRGLAESPEKARALVMAGQVFVADRPISKPGALVDEALPLSLAPCPRYVSRGGEKLEHALKTFALDVTGLVCADVGASTGGFTDCLLQHGAARVYAIDVGKGQLDYRLRRDPRVVVMEGVNVRYLDSLPEPVDLVTVDVSFISLRLVLPVVRNWLHVGAGLALPTVGPGLLQPTGRPAALPTLSPPLPGGEGPGVKAPSTPAPGSILALFKPQFEAEKREVPRGGVIRDPALHASLIGRFTSWCVRNGFRVLDIAASPVPGAEGNVEFLFWLRPHPDFLPGGEG